MKTARILAAFVVFLIASLPITFADIQGGSLNITRSSGNANVPGLFDGYSDNWNIEVRASIGDDAVMPSYLQAQFSRTSLPFDSCSEIAHPFYLCSLKFPQNPASFPENNLILPITLTHPVTGQKEYASAEIGVDAYAPVVTINSIAQKPEGVVADLTVRDMGSKVCSIGKIEFFDGNLLIKTVPLNITGCVAWNNRTVISMTDVGTTLKSVRVIAYDKIGHAGDAISNAFSLDNTPPYIDTASFRFSELGQYDYISGSSLSTSIFINITEEQTTPGVAAEPLNVTADFSALGLSSAEPADSCILVNPASGLYTCRWNRLVTIPQSLSVSIIASDNNAKTSSRTISKVYSIDNTPPVIEYLGQNESRYIVAGLNTIRAELREAQSGINTNDISLDISGINPAGSLDLRADECIQQGDVWNCYWYDIQATQEGSVSLVQVKDIANNFALDLPSAVLNMDLGEPVVNSIQILSLGGIEAERVPYFEEGRYLEITANVTDESGVKASADFRNVVSNLGIVNANCILANENTDEWKCTWSGIGPLISVAATTAKNIEFEFKDLVGNKVTPKITKAIDILDIGINEPNPDYWRSSAGAAMPAQIDRQIAGLMPSGHVIFFPVALSPVTSSSPSSAWPLLVKDVACKEGSGYLHSSFPPQIFNYNPSLPSYTSTLPYTFYIKLAIGTVPVEDALDVNCSFKIMSLMNGRAIPNAETESAVLTANFYNNPLGTVDSAVQSEIDNIKSSWLVKGDWIDIITTFLQWSETICYTTKLYHEIKMMFSTEKDLLTKCCTDPYTAAICCPNAKIAGDAAVKLDNTKEALYGKGGKFDTFCKIINCQLSRVKGADTLGAPARHTFKNWIDFAAERSRTPGDYAYPIWSTLEPKNSMILSTVFLCPTGIFYNLEKARQIECKYAYCLQQSASGMPVDLCVTQRSFSMCMWVWNEVFQWIPFADMTDDMLKSIGDALDDPFKLIGIGTRSACHIACKNPADIGPGCNFCMGAEWANWLLETLCDLGIGKNCEPYWETIDPIPYDYCEQIA